MVQWKNDGEQDKFIVKLIKKGKIHKHTKPVFLKETYPAIFGDFNINVIRNHLNVLKRNSGLFLEELNEDEITQIECRQQDLADDANDAKKERVQNLYVQHNYPILCDVFKDPDTQSDKVVLAICLLGGATNVKIDVNEEGLEAVITYNWPETSFNMEDLFKQQLSSKQMFIHLPMITTLKSSLGARTETKNFFDIELLMTVLTLYFDREQKKVRSRIDVAPESTIVVRFPIKVQSTPESFIKWGVKRENGTLLIVSTFAGHIKIYSKKVSEATVTFNM